MSNPMALAAVLKILQHNHQRCSDGDGLPDYCVSCYEGNGEPDDVYPCKIAYVLEALASREAALTAVRGLRDVLRNPDNRALRKNCSEYMLGDIDRRDALLAQLDRILGTKL